MELSARSTVYGGPALLAVVLNREKGLVWTNPGLGTFLSFRKLLTEGQTTERLRRDGNRKSCSTFLAELKRNPVRIMWTEVHQGPGLSLKVCQDEAGLT